MVNITGRLDTFGETRDVTLKITGAEPWQVSEDAPMKIRWDTLTASWTRTKHLPWRIAALTLRGRYTRPDGTDVGFDVDAVAPYTNPPTGDTFAMPEAPAWARLLAERFRPGLVTLSTEVVVDPDDPDNQVGTGGGSTYAAESWPDDAGDDDEVECPKGDPGCNANEQGTKDWTCHDTCETPGADEARAEFIAALWVAATTLDDGRRVVHRMGGFTGADYDLDAAIADVHAAQDVQWVQDFFGHDLAVLVDDRIWRFNASRPTR